MRPWLALRHAGVDFEEVMHALPELGGKPAFGAISPNARVPALDLGGEEFCDVIADPRGYGVDVRKGAGFVREMRFHHAENAGGINLDERLADPVRGFKDRHIAALRRIIRFVDVVRSAQNWRVIAIQLDDHFVGEPRKRR